jgi:hypothetical protein
LTSTTIKVHVAGPFWEDGRAQLSSLERVVAQLETES